MRITFVRSAAAVGASALVLSAAGGAAIAATDVPQPVGVSQSAGASAVLGPDGFGPLKVGMSLKDALSTGKVGEPVGGTELCRGHRWSYSAGPVLTISRKYGVYSIPGTAEGARTPEGIGLGATPAQIRKAYPHAVPGRQNGVENFTAVTPQNRANHYTFGLKNGKVVGFALQAVNARDCAAG